MRNRLWQVRVVFTMGLEDRVFARVIAAQAAPENLDRTVGVAREQLQAARQQPGFGGFYLLIERQTGKLMTISLWATREDAQAVEARAAGLRSQLTPAIGVAGTPAVEVYEVAVQS
jgi:heme-degrading monooxygenase HmoA